MNFFGKNFRVEIFGESHGPAVGVVIDGVKPGIPLTREDFAEDISRRKSGSRGTTPRLESDEPEILSGVFEGHTTGAPIAVLFRNTNTKSSDYEEFLNVPRPGHADWTASVKWGGMNDPRGGGHFSGRLTLPLVAAGVVAKKQCGFSFKADLVEIGGEADKSKWDSLLADTAREGDSLGGVVECRIEGVPAGLGEPFFDSVESLISHAVFSIPGVRGIEFGDGFAAARMKGSNHNDPLSTERPMLAKNGAGGVNGGITNGAPIVFRVAFKPTSSIAKTQKTLNVKTGEMVDLNVKGRHDVCFALRTPVIVEAVSAIVLAGLSMEKTTE
ncbi:MAG: chorismate synthase [Bacteroidales bacterium]|nr:chorismate synthase [Bacteroidales bacterium]MBP3269446.1 chorismate synthase [Bacteroidales bacterium]